MEVVAESSEQRMSIRDVDPKAYKAVLGVQRYVNSGTLGTRLIALIDIRASQINNCAWCLDMHAPEAVEAGASQRQVDLVAAWAEAGDIFSERERAALALTEQITLISEKGVTDDVWAKVEAQFSEEEIVWLIMAISVINVWNRMNVTARTALPPERA